ncbi:MAG: hypothetical protein QXG55_06070 [Thermoplasmata archaeon]
MRLLTNPVYVDVPELNVEICHVSPSVPEFIAPEFGVIGPVSITFMSSI